MQDSVDFQTLGKAEVDFVKSCPQYESTRSLDVLRSEEYTRLEKLDHVYLDYTGGGLYAESQLQKHMDLLKENVFGNPHSKNPTSLAMTELVERTRDYVLEYYQASPEEYVAIFTLNASGALKLVGESYPFHEGGQYLLTFDNHNSVNGIREYAKAKGAKVIYVPVLPPDLRPDAERLFQYLDQADPSEANLFSYPAQSNFSGVQHPLVWIAQAQKRGWDVLLDAAAFTPTNKLDLSRWHPDFVALSFYKIFGYPTGIGCLLARKEALSKLQRPWFAGGTITVASVQGDGYYLAEGEAGFEDGTVSYLCIPAVEIGLRYIAKLGMGAIHNRVHYLTNWLLDDLTSLRHKDGAPLARIYGPLDMQMRGGTITFNFYDREGDLIDFRQIEEAANQNNISLRTGCFCNPGAGEAANNLIGEDLAKYFKNKERMTFEQYLTVLDGKLSGAVRVSLGLVSNFEDVYRFSQFAREFLE